MKRPIKVNEPIHVSQAYQGPLQEVAVYVRDLLDSDCALVAIRANDSIVVEGFASRGVDYEGAVADDLIAQLHDAGPVIADQGRLVSAPVSWSGDVVGVLIGYSTKPGTFTETDLQRLVTYTYVAAGILTSMVDSPAKMFFTTDELYHFSRLITLGQHSACFAHEVNNPLMLILGHLRFIDESLSADHPLRVNVDVIERASRRIEEMTKRMLDFSRKKNRCVSRCDVDDLVAEAVRFIEPYRHSYFVKVQVEVEPQLGQISADRAQMVQAIVNVLHNAVDAMSEANERVLLIKAGKDGDRIRIVVSDTGIGIRSGEASKVFEPFFTTKGDRGTGLGLFITKRIIEEHCGTIDIDTAGPGTSFVISLPL